MIARRIAFALLPLSAAALLCMAPPPAAPDDAAAPDSYKVDSVHSSVIFRVKHLNTANFYGRFNDIKGEISWDAADSSGSSLSIEIPLSGIDSKSQGRDRHLRSADFFNAEQFPICTFQSTSITPAGENTYNVEGDLTMRGVTKRITVKLEKTGEGESRGKPIIGFETIFTVNRSDYGISYMPGGLSEEVTITVSLEAVR